MNKHRPLISVIMTVYNGERYLAEAVESILHQSYSNFEFIIVDDGSVDKTYPILNTYKDKRMMVYRTNHMGRPSALNYALSKIRGEYVAMQDADDVSLPERFEEQLSFLLKNSSISVVGNYGEWMDEGGKVFRVHEVKVSPEEIRVDLFLNNTMHLIHGGMMYRREVLKEVGGYDERFPVSEDYDFLLRISERFRIANIPKILYRIRVHKDRISYKHSKDERERLRKVSRSLSKERREKMVVRFAEKKHYKVKGNLKILIFDGKKIFGTIYDSAKLCDVLTEIGCEVKTTELSGSFEECLKLIRDEISGFHPNFVLVSNPFKLEREFLFLLREMEVPHVSYFGDSPSSHLLEEMCSPLYYLFVWDKFYTCQLESFGFKHIFYLPPAAVLSRKDTDVEVDVDISIVGNSYYESYKKYYEYIKNQKTRYLFDSILKIQSKNPQGDISIVMRDLFNKVGNVKFREPRFEEEVKCVLERVAAAIYQKGIVEGILDLQPHIFGDYGWVELIDGKINFFGEAKVEDLPELFLRSKINLILPEPRSKLSPPSKVFDILAVGGFPLVDERVKLTEFFRVGVEIVTYKNKKDLREKIKYYLKAHHERERIIKAGQRRVLEEHTLKRRMKEMIDTIREHL